MKYTYYQYADDIESGKIKSCEAIRLAVKRFKEWFKRDDIYFDEEDVNKRINFISKFKHTTGQFNSKPFILLPWQQWVVANIYGWKYKDSNLRVTTKVFLLISRKNGKSSFASALAIMSAVADKENGAEVYILANSRQQAKICFKMASDYVSTVDKREHVFKKYRDSIEIKPLNSKIQVLSSDGMGNDGYNASCFILDEFHANRDWNLWNVMRSSQGMRKQPLSIIISTAGFLLNGYPCYEQRQNSIDILRGNKVDDTQFSAIYELDKEDDWLDESNWIKCCPSLGQTVTLKYMREEVNAARNNSALEVGVKTKNFNMFVQSKDIWIPDKYLEESFHKIDIDDFKDEECYMGVDLSSTSDLTSFSVLFPPNEERKLYPDKFVFKNFIYIPSSAFVESSNNELYKQWWRQKYALRTSGNVVDYDHILKDQLEIYSKTYLMGIAYDSWNATSWATNATVEGLPLVEFSQAIGNFNRPTKQFEILIRHGKVVIDHNPCVRWCFNNVELKTDWNGNVKPIKSGGDNNNKIDPIIAMIQALGIYYDKMGKYSDGEVLYVKN